MQLHGRSYPYHYNRDKYLIVNRVCRCQKHPTINRNALFDHSVAIINKYFFISVFVTHSTWQIWMIQQNRKMPNIRGNHSMPSIYIKYDIWIFRFRVSLCIYWFCFSIANPAGRRNVSYVLIHISTVLSMDWRHLRSICYSYELSHIIWRNSRHCCWNLYLRCFHAFCNLLWLRVSIPLSEILDKSLHCCMFSVSTITIIQVIWVYSWPVV